MKRAHCIEDVNNFTEISPTAHNLYFEKQLFMKRHIFILLVLLLPCIFIHQGCGSGQDTKTDDKGTDTTVTDTDQTNNNTESEKEESIQNKALHGRLEKMIENASNDQCKRFASFLVYTGDDKKRKFRDQLNLNNEAEKYRANSTCQAIGSWLEESSGYEYGSYKMEGHSQLDTIYKQEIVFLKKRGSNRRVFTFMKGNDEYLLMNIK